MGERDSSGSLDLARLFKYYNLPLTDFGNLDVELGDKLIRIWNTNDVPEVIDWFTTEKFLYDLSRKVPFFSGFENYREFTKYRLHYIGISEKNDSFNRLVVKLQKTGIVYHLRRVKVSHPRRTKVSIVGRMNVSH
ncbi:hypothetical protein [Flagellimonas sediminis]|uniref:Uncharacterized protein n=1 Tax=Flagellimonas sediminis TaxID=2696468 RepID=A0A6I5KX18_9FLAO|nr:hypothetical protein [Allomuricauda sediminis]NDV45377.1 hypothetical protein [Allomuricauda sediminis]